MAQNGPNGPNGPKWPKTGPKWPKIGGFSPLSFLYINPYDTREILKKTQKCALFGIPFYQNFEIDHFFRSKPRLKKIVIGGGVKQVGQKRAPQGLFYRILHPRTLQCNFYNSKNGVQWGPKMAHFFTFAGPPHLGPFWAHFGAILGPILGPFWAI